MEIKVNIPKNDYVQPTEVREEVVQAICDAILESKLDCDKIRALTIYEDEPKVCISKSPNGRTNIYGLKAEEGQTNVRTCEMKAAFEAIQDAGFYIYPSYLICPAEYHFVFSKKPYFENRRAERVTFNVFID